MPPLRGRRSSASVGPAPRGPEGPAPSVQEAVPEAPDRDEVPGAVGVGLELLAEPLDVNVERARVAAVVDPPHLLDQEVPREQPALPPEQRLEELELLRRQRDELVPDADPVAEHVH